MAQNKKSQKITVPPYRFDEEPVEQHTGYRPYLRPREESIEHGAFKSHLDTVMRFPHYAEITWRFKVQRHINSICSIMFVAGEHTAVKTLWDLPVYEDGVLPQNDSRYEKFNVPKFSNVGAPMAEIVTRREYLLSRMSALLVDFKFPTQEARDEYQFLAELISNTMELVILTSYLNTSHDRIRRNVFLGTVDCVNGASDHTASILTEKIDLEKVWTTEVIPARQVELKDTPRTHGIKDLKSSTTED